MTKGASLFGLVTDVQVFSRVIDETEAIGYTSCSMEVIGDIAEWQNIDEWRQDDQSAKVEMMEKNTMCQTGIPVFDGVMAIPIRLKYAGRKFLS